MLKFKIHSAKELDRNAKCTVHTSGKLGFSEGGMKRMSLNTSSYVVIASNEEDSEDENLYAWVENDDTNGGFKICKAGDYFYLNTKVLFDEIKINYKDKQTLTIFDIVGMSEEYEGKPIFKLQKRTQKRTSKKKKTDESGD